MSSAASTSRRSRTRDKSGILYAYSEGVRRVSNRFVGEPVHEVDPDEVRFLGASPEFQNSLPELPIPGGGDPYHDCGEQQPLLFCSRCGDPVSVERSCNRSVCPSCWKGWVRERAVSICSKLEGRRRFEETKIGDQWTGLKFHHVIASPPPAFFLRRGEPLEAAKEIVKILMSEVGGSEGTIIYHPWRIAKEHRGDVLGHESGEGDKTWKDILSLADEMGWSEVVDEYLVFEPHFHVLTLSRHVLGGEHTTHLHEKSGWVIHRIADDSGASVRDLPSLCAAAGYSLSHAGIRETDETRRGAVWPYGEVSNFEPTEGVRADVGSAFNSVSQEILGQTFTSGRCSEKSEGVGNSGAGGGGAGAGDLPEHLGERDDQDSCGGRLVPMSRAGGYLADAEWVAGAPRSGDLVEAHQRWIEIESQADRPPPE